MKTRTSTTHPIRVDFIPADVLAWDTSTRAGGVGTPVACTP